MKKREAKFQTIFNRYLKAKKLIGHFELKQTTSDSIAFSAVEDHQIEGLLAAQQSNFVWKYSDEDSRMKPFDCSSIPPMKGYIVIKYPELFCIIYIFDFLQEREDSKRKSLTKTRAQEIAWNVVDL